MPSLPDLSDASDRDVVRLARQRDEHAYSEIVRRYRSRVRRSIYRIVHHTERAKDLAQDTFVKAFAALDRYRSERNLAPWLVTIAKNTARNYLHRRPPDSPNSRHATTPASLAQEWLVAPIPDDDATPGPEPRVDRAVLQRAVDRLRPEYRRCVRLRYVKQRSYEEIADIMNVSVGTVGTYLNRAREELRQRLGPRVDTLRG